MDYNEAMTVRIDKVNFADLQAGDYVRLLPVSLDPMTQMLVEHVAENGTVYFAHPYWEKQDFSGERIQPFGEFKSQFFSVSKEFTHLNYEVTRNVRVPNYFRAKVISNGIFPDLKTFQDWLSNFWMR